MAAESRERRRTLTYYSLSAAGLGLGWFPVLSIPKITRDFLWQTPWQSLFCLAAASVLVAVPLRHFILSARTFTGHLGRAALMPYLGCFAYLCLWGAWWWTEQLLFGGLANLHDTLSLFAMGMTAAVVSFLAVVPYGLLCQYTLHYLWSLDTGE